MDTSELQVMQSMTQEQRVIFQGQYNAVKKTPTTGILLAFFLGGIGTRQFYMGKVGLGILYAVFVWTFVPAFIALIECFFMTARVNAYNQGKASEIAMQVRLLSPAPAFAPA